MRSPSTASSPRQSNTSRRHAATAMRQQRSSRTRAGQLAAPYKLLPHETASHLRCHPSDCPARGRSARRARKCVRQPQHSDARRRPARGRQTHARPRPMRPEFPPSTLRSRPFTCKRFHVLSNSLFKVLFNFPSPYLFAIGLVPVFSLRWSLPPALGCIPKQPDSGKTRSSRGKHPRGPDTRTGTRPRSEGLRRSPTTAQGLPYVTTRHASRTRRFDAGHFPIHSPLLGESPLVSFPPLNNMLKFSG